jgi:hypothetical protein
MPELHIARCDAPGCTNEAPLQTSGPSDWPRMPPEGWLTVQTVPVDHWLAGHVLLCAWACVAAYAMRRVGEEASDDDR